MPIKTNLFNHFVVSSAFVSTDDNVKENDDVDHYTRKNVKAVESSDKEKEICKKTISIFVVDQISALNYILSCLDFFQGIRSGENCFLSIGGKFLCPDGQIILCCKSRLNFGDRIGRKCTFLLIPDTIIGLMCLANLLLRIGNFG